MCACACARVCVRVYMCVCVCMLFLLLFGYVCFQYLSVCTLLLVFFVVVCKKADLLLTPCPCFLTSGFFNVFNVGCKSLPLGDFVLFCGFCCFFVCLLLVGFVSVGVVLCILLIVMLLWYAKKLTFC